MSAHLVGATIVVKIARARFQMQFPVIRLEVLAKSGLILTVILIQLITILITTALLMLK
ncbi:hypothetical protein PSYAE_26600, partial [Pseudomonas amygdali pv. aesculi str. 0893_23]